MSALSEKREDADLLAHIAGGIIPSGPETVHIDVTNTCNLNCLTCWNYSPLLLEPKDRAWRSQQLDYHRFEELLEGLSRCGAKRLIFSGGGEPFAHKRIMEMIEEAKRLKFHLTIITNGTLNPWSPLADLGVDRLLVNLSSATPETYRKVHPNRSEATFASLLEGLAAISGKVAFNLVQVIIEPNHRELNEMIHLADEVGASRVSFKLGNLKGALKALALSEAQRACLLEELIPQAEKLAEKLAVRNNIKVLRSQLGGESALSFPIDQIGCYAGYLYSRVYVDGRVFFCCEHIETGHLDRAAFGDIWRSAQYNAVRERIGKGRYFEGCWRCGKYEMNFKVHRALLKRGLK